MLRDHQQHDNFIGPRSLVYTAALEMHPLDTEDRLKDLKDEGGTTAEFKPPFDLAVAPVPALTPPTLHTTASSRSLSALVGPDPRFNSAPPGAMLTAVGTF